jgi:hypothetical protein
MIADEQLLTMTNEVDQFLVEMVTKHQMDPLSFTGMVLARLVLLNDRHPDFFSLIQSVIDIDNEAPPKTIQ